MIEAGADAVGLMFAKISTRYISSGIAKEISEVAKGSITRVGVFADSTPKEIENVLKDVGLDYLQFSGNESKEECEHWGLPYIKAIKVRPSINWNDVLAQYDTACCLLLDTFVPGVDGGTGRTFDWGLFPQNVLAKLVLAGGLTPDNVKQAVELTNAYGVDVSTGVEGQKKGIKAARLVKNFVRSAKSVERIL